MNLVLNNDYLITTVLAPSQQQLQGNATMRSQLLELSDFDALPHFQRNVLFVIAYRLSYFQVGVSNVTPRDLQPMDLKEWNLLRCKKCDAPVPAGVNEAISCKEAVRGRYLVIQFFGKSDYLSLCEVTVETHECMGPEGNKG